MYRTPKELWTHNSHLVLLTVSLLLSMHFISWSVISMAFPI